MPTNSAGERSIIFNGPRVLWLRYGGGKPKSFRVIRPLAFGYGRRARDLNGRDRGDKVRRMS